MDFKTFNAVCPFVTANHNPVLIRGRHGIGKSEFVQQFAASRSMELVMRRASQMTEGDLLGLPSIENNQTVWNPPDWLQLACTKGVVLFLDEVDRAQPEVRQGIFELTDSRSIAGHKLHPDTLIFAAVNGGEHGSQYTVFEMDPAELDRYTVFDIEPTVEDWLTWACRDNNIHPYVTDFIREHPLHLEHNGDFDPNKVYPSRRSWKRLSDCCSKGLFESLSTNPDAFNIVFNLSTGYVGLEAAVQFQDFLREGVQVTVEDLFSGRLDDARIKHMTVAQHNSLLDRLEQQKSFSRTLSSDELQRVAFYFTRLPSELFMRGFTALAMQENYENTMGIMLVSVDNRPFSAYVVHVQTGDDLDAPGGIPVTTPTTTPASAPPPATPIKRGRGRPRKNPIK